jgi:hypothetical protein
LIGERAAQAVEAIPEPSGLLLALVAAVALLATPTERIPK